MEHDQSGLEKNLAYWEHLRSRAINGELHIASGVARDCDNACSDYLLKLELMLETTETLSRPEAFGTMDSAQQLAAKFHRLAVGETGSARFAITQQIDIIKTMQAVFQQYFTTMEQADQDAASAIGQNQPGA